MNKRQYKKLVMRNALKIVRFTAKEMIRIMKDFARGVKEMNEIMKDFTRGIKEGIESRMKKEEDNND